MKINYWKAATTILLGVLVWVAYSGRSFAAQFETDIYHVTTVDDQQLTDASKFSTIGGNVRIPGKEVKGFSCVSDVHGSLDKGDGDIDSDVTCYILSK